LHFRGVWSGKSKAIVQIEFSLLNNPSFFF
jgi:hypothetical protein